MMMTPSPRRGRTTAYFSLTFLLFGMLIPTGAHAQSVTWEEVYDPFSVETINLQMAPADWDTVRFDTSLTIRKQASMSADGEASILVNVKRKSDPALPSEANPQKVSLKIDINDLVSGQKWRGLTKLSLENSSGIAEGFAWAMHRLASEGGFYETSAGNAAWVRLVVNGSYVGLFTSVEERNKQAIQNRGMWRNQATWLYKVDGSTSIEAGTVPPESPTFDHLCFTPFISGPGGGGGDGCAQPDLDVDLPQWIEMDGFLTLAAIGAYTSNSDALFTHAGKNTFAVDFLPADQRKRIYLPWDLDTGFSFGNVDADIFNIRNGPASEYEIEILGHSWYRDYYRHVMEDLLDGPLSSASLNGFLDRLEPVLAPLLAEDPNSENDFVAMRNWISNREVNIRSQLGMVLGAPRFSHGGCEIRSGFALSLTHANSSGTIYYSLDGSDPRASGGLPSAGATAYTVPIVFNGTTHVMARTLDGVEWSALRQETFNTNGHAQAMRITEIMYHPRDQNGSGDGGDYEFLELKNTGASSVDLSNCRFGGIDYTFPPGTVAGPGQIILLVKHPLAFEERYPTVPYDGVFWGGLAAAGEKIRLWTSDGAKILSVAYENGPPWPQGADGMGYSLVRHDASGDPGRPETWRASTNLDGSPGQDDPAPPYLPGVVINEILSHSDAPLEDAIELYNPTASPIEIGGWYLSDDLDKDLDPSGAVLKKFLIPAGTIVPAGGYKVFYEADFDSGPTPFRLSRKGEEVYLSSADVGGDLTGHIVGWKFGAVDTGISFGRHEMSSGEVVLAPMAAHSFGVENPATASDFRTGTGALNASPAVGPVVINEIMYHPAGSDTEYVELYNLSAGPVDLGAWVLEGTAFTFPPGSLISPGGFLLLIDTTNISEAQFRIDHSVPAAVPIVGHVFDLQNDGEALDLMRPNDPATDPAILVDRVRYNDKAPWPNEADGYGPSLERLAAATYGNDPAHWGTKATPGGSPGLVNQISIYLAIGNNSRWKFNDVCRDLGADWRAIAYEDGAWSSGDGVLGYGESFIRTTLVPDPIPHITTYFRKEFVLTGDPLFLTALTLRANYDDGIVVYLNGVEVGRRFLPSGSIDAGTLATPHAGGSYESLDLTAHIGLLEEGSNVLAVEVHLSDAALDTDLVWDGDLSYSFGSPEFVDTDGDGIPDAWESAHGLDPLVDDAAEDPDGDGCDNLFEYGADTDPQDPDSKQSFTVEAPSVVGEAPLVGGAVIRFQTTATRRYAVEAQELLASGSWQVFVAPFDGDGTEHVFQDPSLLPRRFYRLRIIAP